MSSLEEMKCGACGCKTATLEAEQQEERDDELKQIVLTCIKCKSKTVIRVTKPMLEVEWGDPAEGVFCVGWGGT